MNPRKIVIGSTRYAWVVRRVDAQHLVLRVWPGDRQRKAFPLEVRLRFDDPWLNFGEILAAPSASRADVFQLSPVTPRMVREAIEGAMAAGWSSGQPRDQRDHRLFERGADGALTPAAS
jgi:hypothetical protein